MGIVMCDDGCCFDDQIDYTEHEIAAEKFHEKAFWYSSMGLFESYFIIVPRTKDGFDMALINGDKYYNA